MSRCADLWSWRCSRSPAPTSNSAQTLATLAEPLPDLLVDPDHRFIDAVTARPKVWRFQSQRCELP